MSEMVAGEWMEATIGMHVARCEHLIREEQAKPSPDNALIAVLCDSVRMAREYTRLAQSESGSPQEQIIEIGEDGIVHGQVSGPLRDPKGVA